MTLAADQLEQYLQEMELLKNKMCIPFNGPAPTGYGPESIRALLGDYDRPAFPPRHPVMSIEELRERIRKIEEAQKKSEQKPPEPKPTCLFDDVDALAIQVRDELQDVVDVLNHNRNASAERIIGFVINRLSFMAGYLACLQGDDLCQKENPE